MKDSRAFRFVSELVIIGQRLFFCPLCFDNLIDAIKFDDEESPHGNVLLFSGNGSWLES